jgi:hypothetical protein
VEGAILAVQWRLAGGALLHLNAHLSDEGSEVPPASQHGRLLWTTHRGVRTTTPGWFVAWSLEDR